MKKFSKFSRKFKNEKYILDGLRGVEELKDFPNLPKLITDHPENNILVFQKIRGKSLDQIKEKISFQFALEILFQLATTLYYLDEVIGFRHNDLHLGNVMLSFNDTPTNKIYNLPERSFLFKNSMFDVVLIDFENSKIDAFDDPKNLDLEYFLSSFRRHIRIIEIPNDFKKNFNRIFRSDSVTTPQFLLNNPIFEQFYF